VLIKKVSFLFILDQIEYLVKWEGYSTDDSTWEPSKNLKYVSNMVNEYEK